MVGRQLASYTIVSSLGSGGMGHVYLAHDARLGRDVALKLLPAASTGQPDRVRRFLQEAKAASALNHPNIITIYEIGEVDGQHFIAAEHIDGRTLRQRMLAARMTLPEILDVGTQVASALAAAHDAQIVHRDIKPENVMVRPDGYVKVLDFGLAKLTEPRPDDDGADALTVASNNTYPGVVLGTVGYMSPEQARGLPVDARTDIFSLGVMLYEMVAGSAPFQGGTATDVLAAILNNEPPALSSRAPGVPDEMQRIISKALRKNRDERYQTIKDLLLDLKSLNDAVGRVAKPSDSGTQVRAGTRAVGFGRYKTAAIAALAVLATAAGAAVYSFRPFGRPSNASLAVLPFTNVGADANTEYLADGIPESISDTLSQLPDLKVMSRTSVFSFKGREVNPQEVGRALGVRAVLTGRVARRGENLTINIQLVDARDNTLIWGQQYVPRESDVLAVQETIAKEISDKLRVKLSSAAQQQLAKRPTENLKAFQYYMQAQSYLQRRTRQDLTTAISYCEKAIAEDANYARAYACLSDAHAHMGARGYVPPVEGRRKAEEYARKALALDDNLAEGHLGLGQVGIRFTPYDLELAERELRRTIALSPSLAIAHQYLGSVFTRQKRIDAGIAEYQRARELDPLSPVIARTLASPYYYQRQYAKALDLLRQANEVGPALINTWEIGVYIEGKAFDEVRAELDKAQRERKDDPVLIQSAGLLYAAQGKRAEALQTIAHLERMSGAGADQAHFIAKVYAALNEKEQALTWLERGAAAQSLGTFLREEPVWDPIRRDPRFIDISRRMGLPPE
jgi:eukaryotic-like serine/threonine-protein kinase